MLRILGCEITIASNGEEAVELFRKSPFDVVLMDCQMPILDGFEATKGIRDYETSTGKSRTPVIALTAGTTKNDALKWKSAGMDDLVSKPFSLGDIVSILEKHCPTCRVNATQEDKKVDDDLQDSYVDATVRIINRAALDNIQEVENQTGNPLLPQIFSGYEEQFKTKLVELKSDIFREDAESSSKSAHAIKSMSANIGAEKVKHIAGRMERLGRTGDIAAMECLISELEVANAEFSSEMQSVELKRYSR
jgi:CheY-like chemotaxis protein/HPt (histidine-containing phosphotransfer) domain-containing protein